EQAQEDLSLITSRFDAGTEPEEYIPQRALVIPLRSEISGPVKGPLFMLLAASAMVVLVGCTNLASTLLARGSARANELAVLRALGADRGRIVRRLFTESLLLALFGAAGGLLLAYGLIRALPAMLPSDLPRMAEIGLHPTVAGFTVLVSVGAAILFGLFPALRVSEGDLSGQLRGGGRSVSIARSRGPWRALVIGEVALALLLLTGAGLLIRSFWQVAKVDAGFESSGVLTMNVALPAGKFAAVTARIAYYEALLASVRALPGVESAGMVVVAPLAGYVSNGRISVDDGPQPFVTAAYQVADAGYFDALQIPLIQGRLFEAQDNADTAHVVLVNEALAELAWPGEDPIGKRATGGGMDSYWDQPDAWATVVGVVSNIRQRDLTLESYPTLFFSYRQRADRARVASIIVRAGQVGPRNLTGMLRQTARDLDSDVPVQFRTMTELVTRSLGDRRFLAQVLGAFAAMALLLAALGIYGVVAYTVALRTREIGIRITLGAAPSGVMGMVFRESMATVSMGLLVGLAMAFGLGRFLSGQLFEISPTDPVSLVGTALILLAVAAFASFIPARRAATVDPLLTMRAE
ncbi:MAG: FtsX-like permease family protein, partial [Acidobacteria bacterium]|nr:FtsX-like permease family protein [Acidobacteriota bacterium]